MKTIEITCDNCSARMLLSAKLLSRIEGKTGRVTCKQCHNKVSLDGRSDTVSILSGGSLAEPALVLEPLSSVEEGKEPHLSEYPFEGSDAADSSNDVEGVLLAADEDLIQSNSAPVASDFVLSETRTSLPPPLPEEAHARDSLEVNSSEESPEEEAPAPSLRQLAEQVRAHEESFEGAPSSRRKLLDAPVPPEAREQDDTLSPCTLEKDEEEDGLIPLGREFRSSPFAASARDETFHSLYPEAKAKPQIRKKQPSHSMISQAPAPPQAGELHRSSQKVVNPFEDKFGMAAPAPGGTNSIVLGPDGELLNDVDFKNGGSSAKKERNTSNWVPWALAAAALLALGVSVSNQAGDSSSKTRTTAAEVGVVAPAHVPLQVEEGDAMTSQASDVDSSQSSQQETSMSPTLLAADGVTARDAVEKPSLAAKKSLPQAPAEEAEQKKPAVQKVVTSTTSAKKAPVMDDEKGNEAEVIVPPFSASSASSAMREATALASACRRPGDPTGRARVVVTFAPSGRATRALVSGPPFAGTLTGGCISQRFRSARVPAFSGQHVTVSKTVTIR